MGLNNKNKALVIGGTSGIGLSITLNLLKQNKHVIIAGRHFPSELMQFEKQVEFLDTDIRFFDEEKFITLSLDKNIDTLVISTGVGRIADFDNISLYEIDNLMETNIISVIKLIKVFYGRILNGDFYTCVIASISGMLSSPLFSVYAATKAGVIKFVESINGELIAQGLNNRILSVCPGYVRGTSFYGGKTDLVLLNDISRLILNNLYKREMFFIPEYDSVYKNVLHQYDIDKIKFSINSYKYKIEKSRINTKKLNIGYLSGTFDLFHIGHLNLLKKAKKCCDFLIVGVHPSAAHKGKETYIPFHERKAIVGSCKYVDKVVESTPEDSDSVIKYKANMLFVGSDYKGTDRFKRYENILTPLGVKIIYFPYTQGTSSTKLRQAIETKINPIYQN